MITIGKCFPWININRYKIGIFLGGIFFILIMGWIIRDKMKGDSENIHIATCVIQYNFNNGKRESGGLILIDNRKKSIEKSGKIEKSRKNPRFLLITRARENFHYGGKFFMISKERNKKALELIPLGYWKGLAVFVFAQELKDLNFTQVIPISQRQSKELIGNLSKKSIIQNHLTTQGEIVARPLIIHCDPTKKDNIKNGNAKKRNQSKQFYKVYNKSIKSQDGLCFLTENNKVLAIGCDANNFIRPIPLFHLLSHRIQSFKSRLNRSNGLCLEGLIDNTNDKNIIVTIFTPQEPHRGKLERIENHHINNFATMKKVMRENAGIGGKTTVQLEILENKQRKSFKVLLIDREIRKALFYNDLFSMDLYVNDFLKYYYDGKSKSIFRQIGKGDKCETMIVSSIGVWKKVLNENGGAITLISVNEKKCRTIEDFLQGTLESIGNNRPIIVKFKPHNGVYNNHSLKKNQDSISPIKTVTINPLFKSTVLKKRKCCKKLQEKGKSPSNINQKKALNTK